MPREKESSALTHPLAVIAVVAGVAALYFGRHVLVPLALATLLTFLLAPVCKRLERLKLPRVLSVVVVVVLAFGMVVGLGVLLTDQLVVLTGRLPEYQQNIVRKAHALQSQASGRLSRVTRTIEDIKADLANGQAAQPGERQGAAPAPASPEPGAEPLGQRSSQRPIPVQVVEPPSRILGIISDTLGMLAPPLATIGICAVFVIFMLIQQEDLRDRIIALMGQGHVNVTTEALDDAARRISRYLLMQLIINVTYGVPVGIGLYLLGLPNAALWGLLAGLLRYLPYVGPWIAAAMPILLSLAVFDDWWHVLGVIGLFIALELVSNNFLEPWLYGTSTGLSTVAVLVAAVFWGWLWGPVGLLLSTPMTACLVVISKHIPQLAFLNVLLGDKPVLPPQSRFYQRLLALDQEEAVKVMEEHLAASPDGPCPAKVYDELLLPALHLAEQDHHRGRLSLERQRFVLRSLRAMLDDLRDRQHDQERERPAAGNGREATVPGEPLMTGFKVLCVPVRDEGDDVAAYMLAQFLTSRGMQAEPLGIAYLTGEVLDNIEHSGAAAVCLSAVPPGAITYGRYLCKRIRSRMPQIPLVVGVWDARGDLARLQDRMVRLGADKLVTTFSEVYDTLRIIAQRAATIAAPAVSPREGRADAA